MSVPTPPPSWFASTLAALVERRDLDGVRMCELMHGLVGDACDEAATAALLVALAMKGETADELAAAAAVLREYMVPLHAGRDDHLDTCGTGGDGAGTFNISTATAFVAAAAGAPVVKHGNRAASSRSGSSADVLAALGVTVEGDCTTARRCLERVGMAFCFAPNFHPALHRVAAVRRRLAIRTLFNWVGPLANPSRAPYQLLGVGRLDRLDAMAAALARLGVRRAFVVCGRDGLDEVSLSGPTLVREVRNGQIVSHEWTCDDFHLSPCRPEELRVAGPDQSAAVIRGVLQGQDGPALRIVLANAAAGLLAAERVQTLAEGVDKARTAVMAGRAAAVLDALIRESRA
ncbi:MAG TPA: anthranilate phosphoribosyltransferase [Gemmataceae bacterium]|nr:anthranilate phosphoribosyltransferase [Gemmataceae bacterium]